MRRKIPMEELIRDPEKLSVKISPHGKYISWLEPWKTRHNIMVRNVETQSTKRVTAAVQRGIYGYVWVNNERIVYTMDKGGDENTRLYGVFADGSGTIDYTPFPGVKCSIVDKLEEDDRHLLFQMNLRNKELFDVYRLNVNTGESQMISENPGDVQRWITDHHGQLRLVHTIDGLKTGIKYRESESSQWQEIASYDFRECAVPLFFTPANDSFYTSSNVGRDKKAIFEFHMETRSDGKLLFEHPEVDVETLLYSRKRAVPTGVYYNYEKPELFFFDESRKSIQDFLDRKLPNCQNMILSFDREETSCIVFSGSDRSQGVYYLLKVSELLLEKLFEASPWINEDEMAEMKPISYTSRDGLLIRGYLTLPPEEKPEKLPMVVVPHGGPWTRDNWRFNREIQLLANRGFAVLKMNFRGSTGYGRSFLEAGYGQWGLAMQDDITDGVMWAIEQGIADPKKIAIYGGSYGGYAALMGIVKDPELYAAAVDYVGVSNLFTILENLPPYWEQKREIMYERIGHPQKDRERLLETSPALNTHKINTPLFIAQGANDPRVMKSESDQVVEGLRKRGIKVDYMVKDDEGHGFYNQENSYDFYRAMEKFLLHHMGMER